MTTLTEIKTGTHKAAAVAFLQLAALGSPRDAFARYVGPGFRHHNPGYPSDAESLIAGMEENAARFPDTAINIMQTLEDGALVAVHSQVRMKASEPGLVVVHLFRFEDDRIVEFWDVGQPIPADSPNSLGMF